MKAIKVGYQIYRLPENIPAKDIQALAGFFAVLQRVESRYNFETSEAIYYTEGPESVQLLDIELVDAAEAKRTSDETHARYKAKQAEAQSS